MKILNKGATMMGNAVTVDTEKKTLWKRVFSEPPAKPVIESKDEIRKKYAFWRNSIFITSYLLYAIAYISRGSFTMAMPFMSQSIGVSSKDQGLILSIAALVYGIGRFVNGSIADRGNVKTSLPVSMFLAGLFSVGTALAPFLVHTGKWTHNMVVTYMCLFWGVSSWFQSALFPYCAKSLIRWFPNATRTTWWANFSTSHELGSVLVVLMSLPIARCTHALLGRYELESFFFVPFLFSSAIAIIGFFALQDRPTSIGLPDVEEICETNFAELTEEEREERSLEENLTYFQILKKHILRNKVMWNLAFIYFCVYIFRTGCISWIFKILVGTQTKSQSFSDMLGNVDHLAALKSAMPTVVGSLGIFLAPIISEKLFGGRRAAANFWGLSIAACAVFGFWLGSSVHSPIINPSLKNVIAFSSLGIAGFTINIPQLLVGGICAVESTSKKVAAAATGFASLSGYIGSSLSNLVSGSAVDYSLKKFGDARVLLICWGSIALLGAISCIPLWNVGARKEYSH
ncbi:MAG: MFS transporter [Oscillospiraceae bacterium]|jgi:sugar phosphate permease|nr:MFS transporter [Oscillospiraceae bacterium]